MRRDNRPEAGRRLHREGRLRSGAALPAEGGHQRDPSRPQVGQQQDRPRLRGDDRQQDGGAAGVGRGDGGGPLRDQEVGRRVLLLHHRVQESEGESLIDYYDYYDRITSFDSALSDWKEVPLNLYLRMITDSKIS